MASKLERYHEVWLAAHPYRDEEWLRARLKDSFDVHHVDGDHDNNTPDNLVLIEHGDHMFLHKSTRRLRQITTRGKKYKTKQNQVVTPTNVVEMPAAVPAARPMTIKRVSTDRHGVWVLCPNGIQVYIRNTYTEEEARAAVSAFTWDKTASVAQTG